MKINPSLKLFLTTKLVLTLFVFSVFNCKTKTPLLRTNKISTTEKWKTLDLPNYSVSYPATWENIIDKSLTYSFILTAPTDSGNDAFAENVSLKIQDGAGKDINLDKLMKDCEFEVKTALNNPHIIKSKRQKKGNKEFHKILYTGDHLRFHLKCEKYCFVSNGKAYVLTFQSEKTQFDRYKKTGERIMESFELK